MTIRAYALVGHICKEIIIKAGEVEFLGVVSRNYGRPSSHERGFTDDNELSRHQFLGINFLLGACKFIIFYYFHSW